jgi:hypothetical protein
VVEAVNTVVLPVVLAAAGIAVTWVAGVARKRLNVEIEAQLMAGFHAALSRVVTAMVVKYGPAASPAVIAEQLRASNPDSAGKIEPGLLRQLVADEITRQTVK